MRQRKQKQHTTVHEIKVPSSVQYCTPTDFSPILVDWNIKYGVSTHIIYNLMTRYDVVENDFNKNGRSLTLVSDRNTSLCFLFIDSRGNESSHSKTVCEIQNFMLTTVCEIFRKITGSPNQYVSLLLLLVLKFTSDLCKPIR